MISSDLSPDRNGEGHNPAADKVIGLVPSPVSAIVLEIREHQARRKFYIKATIKLTNSAKAFISRALGYEASDDEADRAAKWKRAGSIFKAFVDGDEQKPENEDIAKAIMSEMVNVVASLAPLEEGRHQVELSMKRAVRLLPVYAWAKDAKGLGEIGLAVIVGEAGDLANYPKKGHLWKRLGLAPFEGKALSTWRKEGGLSADEWTAAGYAPRRRAEIYAVISDPLSKSQIKAKAKSEGKHGDPLGPYGEIYVARQFRTDELHPDWTPKHKQLDALRVMTKYLLRDLWREWNGRKAELLLPQEANDAMPTVLLNRSEANVKMPLVEQVLPLSGTDGREASGRIPETASLMLPTVHLFAAE